MTSPQTYSELGLRLKQAREAVGMSTRHVVALLPKDLAVSHVTLTNYESGRYQAPLDLLAALADVYQRPINWFLERGPTLTGIRYRNKKSKVGVRELSRFEAVAQHSLEAYRRLDEWLGSRRRKQDFKVDPNGSGAEAATAVRKHLKLKEWEPVQSVVGVMEKSGIRVLEMRTDLAIDAMAARLGDEDVVVLNPNVPNDRSRLNAAHELGHVFFCDCEGTKQVSYEAAEKRAFEFASHFLLTRRMLREAFYKCSMVRLVQFKERFGISLAAMIYRAEAEGILPSYIAKQLWIEFSKRGWRSREPGQVAEDRATRFEQILDAAIMNNKLTWQQAVILTGVREDELRQRINLALGTHEPTFLPEKGGDDQPFLRLVK